MVEEQEYSAQIEKLSQDVSELMKKGWGFRAAFGRAFRLSDFEEEYFLMARDALNRLDREKRLRAAYQTKTRLMGSSAMARQAHEDVCPIH